MKHIGFSGGFDLFELGSVHDMLCFFSVIKNHKNQLNNPGILTDRLYRRYLSQEDLDKENDLVSPVRRLFSGICCDVVMLKNFGWRQDETIFDLSGKKNLGDVFERYFYGLNQCIDSARAYYKAYSKDQPVKCVVTDIPDYIYDKMRPLSEYDALGPNDPPFWLR